MTTLVQLPPIRRGYEWGAELTFPEDFFASGEAIRADLRRSPAQSAAAATFASSRDGRVVTLLLSEAQTAALHVRRHVVDLTLVRDGGSEEPLIDNRFAILVEDHVTRASA